MPGSASLMSVKPPWPSGMTAPVVRHLIDHAVGLAGDEVDGAGGGGTEGGAEGVVVHRVVLRVVPHRRDGVAVVVAHGERSCIGDARSSRLVGQSGAVRGADRVWEEVHLAVVERQLLRIVVVVLVIGGGLVGTKAEGVRGY